MKNKGNIDKQQGFTLVELSIVLVIIGLIVSGILVGQDMIKAAEIRSTVSQMEQYNTAVNTFRDKYRNIPGDMTADDAVRFGFINSPARAGTPGQGDGNRLIEGGAVGAKVLGFETGLFWRDLSFAKLIGNSFTAATPAATPAITAGQVLNWLPEAKIGQGNYFAVHSGNGRNFYNILQVRSVAANGAYNLDTSITPQTSFNIDDKMDDGNPVTGTVLATYETGAAALPGVIYTAAATVAGTGVQIPGTATPDTTAINAGACVYGSMTAPFYNTATDAQANRPACQLMVRASF